MTPDFFSIYKKTSNKEREIIWGITAGIATVCEAIEKSPQINWYATDFFCPFLLYTGLRLKKLASQEGAFLTTAILATIAEQAQAEGIIAGTYDPKDFLAYALGTATAVGIDLLLSRNRKSLEEKVEV